MEILDLISNVIGNFGFPIGMCIALFWKMDKQDKEHKEEMQKITDALNNNTIVLQKLTDKIGGDIDVTRN